MRKNNKFAANIINMDVILSGAFLIFAFACFFIGITNIYIKNDDQNILNRNASQSNTSGILGGLPKGDVSIINSGDTQLEPGISDEILGFYYTYFNSLGALEEKDLTAFFDLNDEKSAKNALINQTSLAYLVGSRKAQPNDLVFKKYSCQLSVTGIKQLDKGEIEVELDESNTINFNFISDVDSISSGIDNIFIFTQTDGGWKIASHERSEDSYSLIEDEYLSQTKGKNIGTDKSREILNEIKTNLLAEAAENVNIRKNELMDYIADKLKYSVPEVKRDNNYDRDAAVAYAMKWVSPVKTVRNDQYESYDDLGGNCTNYISQCIHAGGIPMDTHGEPEVQWKWYGDAVDESQTPNGRSASWPGVPEFYYYCMNNTGYGMAASVDENLYSGEKADILQYGTDNAWKHSVIITNVVKDSSGNTTDYLINSNTTDRINYPASAYSYYKQRLIKIYGWNNS